MTKRHPKTRNHKRNQTRKQTATKQNAIKSTPQPTDPACQTTHESIHQSTLKSTNEPCHDSLHEPPLQSHMLTFFVPFTTDDLQKVIEKRQAEQQLEDYENTAGEGAEESCHCCDNAVSVTGYKYDSVSEAVASADAFEEECKAYAIENQALKRMVDELIRRLYELVPSASVTFDVADLAKANAFEMVD